MRLTPGDVQAIREEVARFDPTAEVVLFGSRTDDRARGGDIDLWVRSTRIGYEDRLRLKVRLEERLGDRHVDLTANRGEYHPLAGVVTETGIPL